MDYLKLNNIDEYIGYAIRDTEGYGIDGGVKYGGTTIVFFPTKKEADIYGKLFSIGDRKKIYATTIVDYVAGKILSMDIHNWDGSKIDDNVLKDKTVIMLFDRLDSDRLMTYAAKRLIELGAGCVYVFARSFDEDVLDDADYGIKKNLADKTIGEVFTCDSTFFGQYDGITFIDPSYDKDLFDYGTDN